MMEIFLHPKVNNNSKNNLAKQPINASKKNLANNQSMQTKTHKFDWLMLAYQCAVSNDLGDTFVNLLESWSLVRMCHPGVKHQQVQLMWTLLWFLHSIPSRQDSVQLICFDTWIRCRANRNNLPQQDAIRPPRVTKLNFSHIHGLIAVTYTSLLFE